MTEEAQTPQEQIDAPDQTDVAAAESAGAPAPAEQPADVSAEHPVAAAVSEAHDQPAEEVDLVSLARTRYEVASEVEDALVIEFLEQVVREPLQLQDWSTALLLAVLQGKFRYPESEFKHLIVVYAQRVELPAAWNDNAIVNYLRTGQEPKRTTTGVWLVDVTRANRIPSEWSTAELEAWARGEVQAGGKSHDNGVAIELKARLGLKCEDTPKSVRKAYRALSADGKIKVVGAEASQPEVVQPSADESLQLQHARAVTAQIERVEGLSTLNVALIDSGLSRFIQATQPNRAISEADALKAQRDLDTTLQYIVGLEPQAMVAGMNRLKTVFKEQMAKGGVFDANNVFRFTHLMRTDNFQQQRHKGLLEMCRIYFADAREARKQIDPKQLLQHQAADKVPLLIEYFTRVA